MIQCVGCVWFSVYTGVCDVVYGCVWCGVCVWCSPVEVDGHERGSQLTWVRDVLPGKRETSPLGKLWDPTFLWLGLRRGASAAAAPAHRRKEGSTLLAALRQNLGISLDPVLL